MSDFIARIKPKKSSTTGEVPQASDLEVAEIAVNTADGKLFVKHTDNSIKEISGGGGGTDISSSSLGELSDVVGYGGTLLTPKRYDTRVSFGTFPTSAGQWRNFDSGSPDVVQFYKTDSDANDNSAELLQMVTGDQLQLSDDQVTWIPITLLADAVFSAGGGGNTAINLSVSDADGTAIAGLTGQVYIKCDKLIGLPSDGQVLAWVDANSQWEPSGASGVRALLGIGEYVDDAAAGTGGVASGAMYYNTTSSDYRLKT